MLRDAPEEASESTEGFSVAIQQIRAAEAARVLGLLDTDRLAARAQQWVDAGITTEGAYRLSDADSDTSPDELAALVKQTAAETGVHFSTTAEARAVHAQSVIASMATSADLTGDILRFSNNYTDEVTGKLSGVIRRLRGRG